MYLVGEVAQEMNTRSRQGAGQTLTSGRLESKGIMILMGLQLLEG